MNIQRLEILSDMMKRAVDRGECAGVQAAVVKDSREVWHAAAGMADVEAARPMSRDTLFRMFSSTKCVTGLAAAMCVDRGFFTPRAAVCEYLPGFRDQLYWDGTELRPVGARTVYIHDLLNMTSGICYPGNWNPGDRGLAAEVKRLAAEIDAGDYSTGTVEFANRIGRVPLSFFPGDQWAYGMNADVVGALVEVATGKRYGEWLRDEIFGPLGMDDTGFSIPPEKRGRLAGAYAFAEDGARTRIDAQVGRHLGLADYDPRTNVEMGGAGLVSTIGDWCKLMAMLQAGGTWNGHRFLSPAGMRLMTSPQLTPEQAKTFNWQDQPGQNYGFFNHIKVAAGPSSNPCNVGTYGWGGMLGTNSFVDPVEKLSLVVMIQNAPAFTRTCLTYGLRNPLYAALD